MSFKLAPMLALVVGSLAVPAGAQVTGTGVVAPGSTTINFNSLSDGTDLTTQLALLGVTISGYACASSFYSGFFGGDIRQVTNAAVGNCPGVGFSGTAGPLTFTFSNPITSFVFNGAVNSGDMLTFTNAHGSFTVAAPLFTNPLVGIQDATPFTSVTVSAGPVHPAFIFDNLSFAGPTTATPEPATLALVGSGLLAMAGFARYRKRDSSRLV